MFSLKTRKTYQSPRTKVAEVDLEGLVCLSGFEGVTVDEIDNMNRTIGETKHDGPGTEHYFEF